MILLSVALAPVILLLVYVNYRDKYEKEPRKLLAKVFIFGVLTVIPVIFTELALSDYWHKKYSYPEMKLHTAAYDSFVVAAFTEEFFKILVFFVFIWKNKNFNEKFDAIVYAVFISMGFAAAENVMYVFGNGFGTGVLRAFTAVPAHAVFAVSSGYFLALAKFKPSGKYFYLFLSLFIPILIHGFYDFIILSEKETLLLLFIPYLIFILFLALKGMKTHSDNSVFKKNQ